MLVTNGIATVLLVFHPYYRDSFNFEVDAAEMVDGSRQFRFSSLIFRGAALPRRLPCAGASIRSNWKAQRGSTSNQERW